MKYYKIYKIKKLGMWEKRIYKICERRRRNIFVGLENIESVE